MPDDDQEQWRPDSPVELADRTLRCKRHGLEVCAVCKVDYTFMRDVIVVPDDEYEYTDDEDGEGDEAEEVASDEEYIEDGLAPVIFGPDGERTVGQYVGIVSIPPTSHIPREDMPIENSIRPTTSTIPSRPPVATPTRRFAPPNTTDTPPALFVPQSAFTHGPRYVRRTNYQDVLVYASGACLDGEDVRAGCAFVFHPSRPQANVRFPLERAGPDGVIRAQTRVRAEIRAAIAALHYRAWDGEGFARVIIATDSEGLVLGITERLEKWEQSEWEGDGGEPVVDRDLWEILRDEVKGWEAKGVQPMFWLLPKEMNNVADAYSRQAAALEPAEKFAHIIGVQYE
ncbi:hypothetical protein EVG20_g9741 [Dentipellis fragilis]|uniref:ribonuclease H n=1 Tax=Dentipellis fragilis TaxID=205917 RepID=A0A4Y9XW34_9AGAM|nr:hypothetical protein EVG20_g9741 [Dentipellis fragilis]